MIEKLFVLLCLIVCLPVIIPLAIVGTILQLAGYKIVDTLWSYIKK